MGWAQALYLTGQLSAAWMPESYRQVSDTFAWTVGDIGCVDGLAAAAQGWSQADDARLGRFQQPLRCG